MPGSKLTMPSRCPLDKLLHPTIKIEDAIARIKTAARCLINGHLFIAQVCCNFSGVCSRFVWGLCVVRANGVPSIPHALKVVCQYPGPDMGVDTRIGQVISGDPVSGKGRQPGRVDLHVPSIPTSVCVPVECGWVSTRLYAGD